MSVASVKAHFEALNLHIPILETAENTATVVLAAAAHGVEPGRIAKTLAFELHDKRVVLLVARGDTRIDNAKFKTALGKGKMLSPDVVADITGHPVGGVCPFGLAQALPIYLDASLQAFDEVLPAAGSVNSAVRMSVTLLAHITQGQWVDVCRPPTDAG